jgi:hypothetical protein
MKETQRNKHENSARTGPYPLVECKCLGKLTVK